jgi:uncharacterized protein (DUF1501 family)
MADTMIQIGGRMAGKFLTRRSVLSAGWRAVAAAPFMGLGKASPASDASGRNLVCLYLFGGSDGNSMFAPLDGAQYNAYAAVRGELALPQSALLAAEARSGGMRIGFHPELAGLHDFFLDGSLALIANLGSQQRTSGESGLRYEDLIFMDDGYATLRWAASKFGDYRVGAFTFSGGSTMLPLGGSGFSGLRRMNGDLLRFAESATRRMAFPDSNIGRSLRTVAGLLQSGRTMGSGQQFYFVPVADLNPVAEANEVIGGRYRELSHALSAFRRAMISTGLDERVTLFTDSEFGRTLRPNAAHGSDSGWGNHHLVLGGGVRGGDVYGQFPDMTAAMESDGAMAPSTMREQYHGTLASWLGLTDGEVTSLFPSLAASGSWRMEFVAT